MIEGMGLSDQFSMTKLNWPLAVLIGFHNSYNLSSFDLGLHHAMKLEMSVVGLF
jgi:hypothetical protein